MSNPFDSGFPSSELNFHLGGSHHVSIQTYKDRNILLTKAQYHYSISWFSPPIVKTEGVDNATKGRTAKNKAVAEVILHVRDDVYVHCGHDEQRRAVTAGD